MNLQQQFGSFLAQQQQDATGTGAQEQQATGTQEQQATAEEQEEAWQEEAEWDESTQQWK